MIAITHFCPLITSCLSADMLLAKASHMAKPKIQEQKVYFGYHDAKASDRAKPNKRKWRNAVGVRE